MDHTLNRQYPSNLGRWLTPDPAGLMAVRFESRQTWNMYAYVGNNPLTLTDPSGESWFTHIMDLLWLPWWTPHQAVGDPPPETPPPPSILIPPPGPPKWKYSQTTGQLSVSILGKDTKVGKPGYAGHNEGLNNAANQYVAEDPKDPANDNAGPLPQAMYFIGKLQDNVTGTGKVLAGSMRLTPEPGAQMHEPGTDTEDRGGFLFHGGNFVTMGSSQGCIVERPPVRYTVGNSGIFELQVVP